MNNLIAILALTFVTVQAHADLKSDIEVLRGLAPEGSDVAKIQAAILQGTSEAEALQYAEGSYLIQDIDGDSINDILVIFEQNPSLKDDKGQACPKEDYEVGCRVNYGDRVIQFWKGEVNGFLFDKVSENSKIVLRADDGGVFGEPLVGLTVTKKGSIVLGFYGGSAWRWSYDYTFQFRSNDLYLVGHETTYGWNGDGRFEATSVNYLTGKVIKSSAKNGDSKVQYKTSRVPKKALVALPNVNPIGE